MRILSDRRDRADERPAKGSLEELSKWPVLLPELRYALRFLQAFTVASPTDSQTHLGQPNYPLTGVIRTAPEMSLCDRVRMAGRLSHTTVSLSLSHSLSRIIFTCRNKITLCIASSLAYPMPPPVKKVSTRNHRRGPHRHLPL